MSNSNLVTFIKLSPNCTRPRLNKIDTIVIHHMAGVMTVEQCGNGFASAARQASSNYGVDSSGNVGLYVDEANRSWATSSPAIDNRAVTIEVANDKAGGNWHVSDKALKKTIELCADICKRNGIKKLNFTGDKTGNLLMHRYFAPTACPGEYLASKFPYIAKEVNKILNKKGDELTMTQYEELKKENKELKKQIDKLTKALNEPKETVYHYTKDVPEYGRPTVQKLLDKGFLKGENEADLNLPESMFRTLVVLDRSGAFDK